MEKPKNNLNHSTVIDGVRQAFSFPSSTPFVYIKHFRRKNTDIPHEEFSVYIYLVDIHPFIFYLYIYTLQYRNTFWLTERNKFLCSIEKET
jgi:hypothetical protein